jgi:hypothetical protein
MRTAEGVCDSRCYDAEHERCTCICRGANHGIGRELAQHKTIVRVLDAAGEEPSGQRVLLDLIR